MMDQKPIFSAFIAIVIGPSLLAGAAHGALIPPGFIDCVVSLGSMQVEPTVGGQVPVPQWHTEGTGFFYGYLIQDDPDPTKRMYEEYLVTARHVVAGHTGGDLHVRVNSSESATPAGQEFTLSNQSAPGMARWFFHPDPSVDVAIIQLNPGFLKERRVHFEFFANDIFAADTEKLRSLDVTAGDGVFVLGFPMGIAGAQRNYVIVRQGAVARISEMLDHAARTFLLDAFVFPGNSGGPVILKPEITAIAGTKSQATAYLIGLVTGYTPYNDIAISTQTHQPRVIFQENSGLAEVIPTDRINEAVAAWRRERQPATAPAQ
jgi:S1-C subfamily serine protease